MIADHVQVLTRVTGYSVEPPPIWDSDPDQGLRRRYLGFNHGRVVESGERVSFDDYRAWLRELDSIVVGDRQHLGTFFRYAADAKDVHDPTPRNVLLDLYEVLESYKTAGNEQEGIPRNRRLEIDDLCQDVEWKSEPSGKSRYWFWVTANGHACEIEIKWDKARRRYSLVSRSLDKIYRPDPERGSLVSYLNREQSFRVLPSDKSVIYVDGDFYELMIPVGPRFDKQRYHVGKILRPLPALRSLWDEKGCRCLSSGADWDADSLFGFISRGITGSNEITDDLGNVDIAVCDDMGTEIADFILADKNRVIFVHSKGIGRSAESVAAYSAGKLSLVCAQAIKNVQYLSMFNKLKPKNLKRWSEPWSSPDTTEGQVLRRIIRPLGRHDNEKIWQQLRERIGNPRTTREV